MKRCLVLLMGLLAAGAPATGKAAALGARSSLKLAFEVRDRIHRHYLEPVDSMRVIDAAIDGLVAVLPEGENLYISPTEIAELRAGDEIVEIEGVTTEGITSEQVMKKLRGAPGTRVHVTVRRQGRANPLQAVIPRERIQVHSVAYAFMVRPGTGYVRITRFAETTARELGEALERLQQEGMARLLLDLRGNGGGLLSQAVEVADCFVPSDELIVYTEGRGPDSRREYRAAHAPGKKALPLVVLIDHGSASASEIVAGAVQDLDVGLVAGSTSFGKGLVQEQFPLSSNGGLLLLTVARYYTPLGRLIQRPYDGDVQAYVAAGLDDTDPNAVDSLRAGKPLFRTRLGRPVWGGGGITPDVPLAEAAYPEALAEVMANGAVADFCSRWTGDRPVWTRDFASFHADFRVSDWTLERFRHFLAEGGQDLANRTFDQYRERLRHELKAGVAQVLWGEVERYQVSIEMDRQVQQALELFGRADALLAARSAGY
ncbi:MAG: S41 family peptidase [Candidatus Latescibacterota bacterium]